MKNTDHLSPAMLHVLHHFGGLTRIAYHFGVTEQTARAWYKAGKMPPTAAKLAVQLVWHRLPEHVYEHRDDMEHDLRVGPPAGLTSEGSK